MNKILTVFFASVLFNAQAQQVIRVRGKHSRELIHTFKKGESLSRGESKIHIKADGAGYEFSTMTEDYRFFLYKNGKCLGEYAGYYFSDDAYWVKPVRQGEQKRSTLYLKSGQKFGPYERVYPVMDYSNNSITGIQYQENGRKYMRSLLNGKTYGPFSELSVAKLTKEETIFSYKTDAGCYVVHNEDLFGPYKDTRTVHYHYNAKAGGKFYFHYQDADGNWHTWYDQAELPYAFRSMPPTLTVFDNGKIMLMGYPADGVDQAYFIEGKKYDYKPYLHEIETNSFGDVLTVKSNPERSYSAPAQLFENGQPIGTFKRGYITRSNCHSSSYYQALLTDTATGLTYVYGDRELRLLGKEEEINNYQVYLVGNDYFHVRKSDSTLIKNGEPTEHKKVTMLDLSHYPSDIVMVKKEGGYDVFYKNGKPMSYAEIKTARYNPDWYNIKDNPLRFETIDDKTYISAKGSSKKFGPVNRGNDFVFSAGSKHLGECNNRKMEIYIDNKLFSPGFSLAYHPQMNAFYWLSIDKDKLYLHCYQND